MRKNPFVSGAAIVLVAGTPHALGAGPFGAEFDLTTLDGTNGFVMRGAGVGEASGRAVSGAGDINGDGFDDLIVGAPGHDREGQYGTYQNVGRCHIVFGGTAVGASGVIELADLDGSDGFDALGTRFYYFRLNGRCGDAVSCAGDFNGDDIDDLLIGSPDADSSAGVNYNEGETYVLLGGADVGKSGSEFAGGSHSFTIAGNTPYGDAGQAVSAAGDINGDGFDDVLVGAARSGSSYEGDCFVVFGHADPDLRIDLIVRDLDGSNGFRVSGDKAFADVGLSVSNAGDFNSDGFDDIAIGASGGDFLSGGTGIVHVVFGGPNVGSTGFIQPHSLDGANGFTIRGIQQNDGAHLVASAGDFNGDGHDDLIVGAFAGDAGGLNSGESYVIFGGPGVGASGFLDLAFLNGENGFVIVGEEAGDRSGHVHFAGDINDDGLDDIIIGGATAGNSGAVHVVFGSSDPVQGRGIMLEDLNGIDGFVVRSINPGDRLGVDAASAGDVNGDGIDDIILGADLADPNGQTSGESYVIFGASCSDADLSGDCIVGSEDLAELLSNWGPCSGNLPGCPGDLDADGAIGASDLALLIGSWTE